MIRRVSIEKVIHQSVLFLIICVHEEKGHVTHKAAKKQGGRCSVRLATAGKGGKRLLRYINPKDSWKNVFVVLELQ